MLQVFKNGQGSIVLRAKLLDSSSTTGAGLTGLTSSSGSLIISTIADNEATATAYTQAGSTIESITTLGTYAAPTATKCRFKEVDNTNHKGIYEFQFADARFAVSSAKSLLVSVAGASNLQQADFVIQLTSDDPYVAKPTNSNLLSIDSNGRVDVIKIAGTTQTARDIGASVLLSSGTGTGQLDFTSGVVKANATQWLGGTIPAVNQTGVPLVDLKYTLGTISPATAGSVRADAVTGAVGSVTGSVGSVTGSVGSVTGAVGSVTARVTANTDQLAGQTVTAAAGVTFPTSVASPTNITAGTITTATNLTNAPTNGDFTAVMKTSIGTAVAASAVASVTGNVGGNVNGNVVGNVNGNLVGDVQGSVANIGAGGIDTFSFAPGAINNATFDIDAITADALAPDAIAEIQAGLATSADVTAATTKRNLVTYSRRFELAPWIQDNATLTDGQTAPNGTLTATKLVEDNTVTSAHDVYQEYDPPASQERTLSVYAKAAERTFLFMSIAGLNGDNAYAFFDLTTGDVGEATGTNFTAAGTQDIGDGWYRCWLQGTTATGVVQPYFDIQLATGDTGGDQTYSGDGASGAYIWEAQFEVGALTAADPVPRAETTGGGASAADIADAVWDEALAGHAVSGSTGEALTDAATGGSAPTAGDVADAVWDEARAGHVGAGSFGEGVASVQGNVTGSTASVAGAVGSVTGNVGGNVTGSVASVVGNVGGNVTGTVASVVGAVGSVTGNVGGNVTGTVASVVGNVGGNVTGSVGSVVGAVGSVTGAVGSVTGAVGSVTGNVGGNVVGTVASVVGAVGSVTGNVGGNVTGTVASVVGNVGGNVTGSVGSVATGGIAAASFAAGAINAAAIATDAIDADAIKADAVTEIQSGLATAASIVTLQADTDNIQTRLPTSLVSGRMDSSVGAMAANTLTASALATDAVDELVDANWNELLSGHAVSGSTGEALSASGAGGNPWTVVLDGTYTAQELINIIAAEAAGKTLIVDTTFGANVTFRNLQDSADVIAADMGGNHGNERLAVTLTP